MKVLRLRLHVRGPILTQSSAIGPLGVDSPVLRDTDGTPLIAGTHLTGKLRQALLELADGVKEQTEPFATKDDVLRWFGGEDPGKGEARKIVLISDLRAVASEPEELLAAAKTAPTRTRVAIDPVSGTVLEGALQVLETPFPAGSRVAFDGVMRILAPGATANRIEKALERGLRWIPQLGGERTVGFGRLERVEIDPEALPCEGPSRCTERWRLTLRFLEPFCIAKPLKARNLYESEEVVPGGVVKGALAYQLVTLAGEKPGTLVEKLGDDHEYPALARRFSALRITHLFPARLRPTGRGELGGEGGNMTSAVTATRPRVPPLSLVKDKDGRLHDVALRDGPMLIDGEAPSFAVDWKDGADVDARFGWHSPPTELRVRTAMDFETRSARTDRLFAYETIVPDEHVWIGEIDLAEVKDERERRDLVNELERLVQGGLAGLGKTMATAQVRLEPVEREPPTRRPWGHAHHVLTLQTPALLCTPADMRGGAEGLLDGYRQTFEQLSGGTLEPVRFFADQRLAGGQHYAARYMRDTLYLPWVLTEPGSVFVVAATGKTDKARKEALDLLQGWERRGLEIAKRIREAEDYPHMAERSGKALWEQCPFVRENGYGEVALDMPEHLELLPDERFVRVEPVGQS